ncbi:hypothetical protein K4K58_005849 [Colletotrichum sp. SAR11_239]|nr:hypothetical protein K4K58_005849 [Colletotrichum sp. SAR11_239]
MVKPMGDLPEIPDIYEFVELFDRGIATVVNISEERGYFTDFPFPADGAETAVQSVDGASRVVRPDKVEPIDGKVIKVDTTIYCAGYIRPE